MQRLAFTRQVCKSPNAVQMVAGRMELGSGQCSEEVDNGLGWTSCSVGLWTLPVEETISWTAFPRVPKAGGAS